MSQPTSPPVHRTGRTSTLALQALDPWAASLSATSRSGASMIQKPAICSFDSRKGPSVNIASSPRLSMTVAVLGAARPPAKTQWPSAWSRSLNTSMAAISSGVARPVLSSITPTRYCIISDHLPCFGRPSRAASHPCYEHLCPDPTPPRGFLSRTFWYAGAGGSLTGASVGDGLPDQLGHVD